MVIISPPTAAFSSSGFPRVARCPRFMMPIRSQELIGLAHIVGGHHNGGIVFVAQLFNQSPDDAPGIRVEPDARSSRNKTFGLLTSAWAFPDDASCRPKSIDHVIFTVGQFQEIKHFLDALLSFFGAYRTIWRRSGHFVRCQVAVCGDILRYVAANPPHFFAVFGGVEVIN